MAQLATLTVKLQAQIAEFQADFKEAAKSTEKFQTEFQGVATKASAYGNLIARGLEIGISAVKQLGEAALKNASTIDDLSKKTGLSMRTIQEFQHVAGETGTTVDAFANAAFHLGTALAGGGKSVVAGVKALGLEFDAVRQMGVDEQFRTIIKALEDMDDQQEANRIGVLLFKRSYKEMAVAVAEGYSDLAAGARIMADEQVKRLAAAEDAWKRLGRTAVIVSGEVIGASIDAAQKATSSWENFFRFLANGLPGLQGRVGFAPTSGSLTAEQLAFDKSFNELAKRQSLERIESARKAADAEEEAFKRSKKAAEDYAAALGRLRASQIPLTVAQQDFTDAQLKFNASIGDIAKVLRISETAVGNYAKAQESLAKDSLKAVSDAIKDVEQRIEDIGEAYERDLVQVLKAVADDIAGVEQKILDTAELFERDLTETLKFVADEIKFVEERINDIGKRQAASSVNPFREAFENMDLPGIILAALRSDSLADGVAVVASGLASEFTRVFAARVAEAAKNGTQLSGSSKAIGMAGLGLSSFIGGFGAGQELGKGKGALAGAGAGAVAGIPLAGVTGGASIAIGAIAGAIGGWIGGMKKAKEALADLREAQAAVLQEFGGFDALKAKADSFGISIGSALTTKNADQFRRTMEELGKAIDAQKVRLEGFGIAVEGINTKAALFAAPFEALLQNKDIDGVTAKLAEMGQRGQAEFERIGTFAAAAFAGMVKESGDAIGAINALAPTLTILQKGLKEFGLTSTGTIDSLLGMFSFINDAVTGPIFASIQATGQIFDGLTKGGLITKDIFQTVATDIGASFSALEAKGGDVAMAMALSQPVLQKLWEGQKLYGAITDETTQRILTQAHEQGLVGDHMKDVNQKILDVLIEIKDIFGKGLPDAFRATKGAAQDAARGIQSEFGKLRLDPIRIQIEYDDPGFPGGQVVPRLAHGGIVRRPTLALVGEAGPEAVVPLNQLGSVSPQGTSTVIFEVAGQQIARATVPYLPGEIRRYVPA